MTDRSANISGLDRHALRTAQLLVRSAIALHVWKFQTNSRPKQYVFRTALGLIGTFACGLGLLLRAAHAFKNANSRLSRKGWRPVFEEAIEVFVNPSRAGGSTIRS
jgi:hypothetical protein